MRQQKLTTALRSRNPLQMDKSWSLRINGLIDKQMVCHTYFSHSTSHNLVHTTLTDISQTHEYTWTGEATHISVPSFAPQTTTPYTEPGIATIRPESFSSPRCTRTVPRGRHIQSQAMVAKHASQAGRSDEKSHLGRRTSGQNDDKHTGIEPQPLSRYSQSSRRTHTHFNKQRDTPTHTQGHEQCAGRSAALRRGGRQADRQTDRRGHREDGTDKWMAISVQHHRGRGKPPCLRP